jgi:hypothetical protein
MNREVDDMGPIDYLLVEFPAGSHTGEGLPLLLDLVDRGIVRVLDLVFLRREEDGSITVVPPADVDPTGELELAVFEGAASGLVDPTDVAEAGSLLDPGSSGVILVYENSWAAPLARAIRRGGGQLVASERIPVQALLAALDQVEAPA